MEEARIRGRRFSTPNMLEVRPGLLLGSMGDSQAVFSRVPSVVARYHVTHVLSLCNERPEWIDNLSPEGAGGGSGSDGESENLQEDKGNNPSQGKVFLY